MSAIAGIWSFGDEARATALCGHLLDAQSAYGPHARDALTQKDYAAGRCLYRLLPEDRFDRQPLASDDGRFLLVADLRIDNRDELIALLSLGTAAGARLSDSALLLKAWLAWGRGLLTRMIGDFAFALWDDKERSLWLARDTAGERPLHYRRGDGFFAFATMPLALARLPGSAFEVDEERIAGFVADLPSDGGRSFFAGVGLLEPGHCALVTPAGIAVERYWEPSRRPLHFARREQYGEALREQLDAAVARRLRRSDGLVGSQLSSGFDSSAVTTSAALALAAANERLLAFTSAPSEDFAGPLVAGRIGDESAIAAATAALHSNIDHRVIRPCGASALDLLETSHRLSGQPVGHVCNNVWWQGINRSAGEAGVRVMLTGEAGNFTISAGLGVDTLGDLVHSGAWGRWWREARALRGRRDFSWLQMLNASFGSWLPESLYARLRGRRPELPLFVAPAWQGPMRRRLEAAGPDVRPPRDSAARRWKYLRSTDPGNYRKRSLAEWGVEERDPTNDRRLVDFCFSLPAEALLDGGVRRPALRRALSGRVPAALLDQRLRGQQMPDWYEQIIGDDVRAFARAEAASGLAGSVIDLAAVDETARTWPASGWEERPIIYLYRMQLLRTLAAASFVSSVRSSTLG
ncbi:MAG TPA: asparagine synthase-related protein [Allosphingosinicella sp.]|nr:asparagine synthase-related protein [Allosphingosinicella sp.]